MALALLADDEEWFNIPHVVRIALRSIADSSQQATRLAAESQATVNKLTKHVASLEHKVKTMESDRAAEHIAARINTFGPQNYPHPSEVMTVSGEAMKSVDARVSALQTAVTELRRQVAQQSQEAAISGLQQQQQHGTRSCSRAQSVSGEGGHSPHHHQHGGGSTLRGSSTSATTTTALRFDNIVDPRHQALSTTNAASAQLSANSVKAIISDSLKALEERIGACSHGANSLGRELRHRVSALEISLAQFRAANKSFQSIEVEAVREANSRVDAFVRDQSEKVGTLADAVRRLEDANTKMQIDIAVSKQQQQQQQASASPPQQQQQHVCCQCGNQHNHHHHYGCRASSSSPSSRSPTPSRAALQHHQLSPAPLPPAITIDDWARFNSGLSDLRTAVGALKNDVASRSTDVNDQLKELLIRYESLKHGQLDLGDAVAKVTGTAEYSHAQLKTIKKALRDLSKARADDEEGATSAVKKVRDELAAHVAACRNDAKTADEEREKIHKQLHETSEASIGAERAARQKETEAMSSALATLEQTVDKYGRRLREAEQQAMKAQKEQQKVVRQIDAVEALQIRQHTETMAELTSVHTKARAAADQQQQQQQSAVATAAAAAEAASTADSQHSSRRLAARIGDLEAQIDAARDSTRQRIDLLSSELSNKASGLEAKCREASARMDQLTAACSKQFEDVRAEAGRRCETCDARQEELARRVDNVLDRIDEADARIDEVAVAVALAAAKSSDISPRQKGRGGSPHPTYTRQSVERISTGDHLYDEDGGEGEYGGSRRPARSSEAAASASSESRASSPDRQGTTIQQLKEHTEAILCLRSDVDSLKGKTVPLIQSEISALGLLTSKCTESMTLLAGDFDRSLQKASRDRTEDLRFVDMLESRMSACEVKVEDLISVATSSSSPPLKNGSLLNDSADGNGGGRGGNFGGFSSTKLAETFVSDLLQLRSLVGENDAAHGRNLEKLRAEVAESVASCEAHLSTQITSIAEQLHTLHESSASAASTAAAATASVGQLHEQFAAAVATASSAAATAAHHHALHVHASSSSAATSATAFATHPLSISTADLSAAVAEEVKREIEGSFYTRDEVDSMMMSQMMTLVGRLNSKVDARPQ